jgi:putative membrane protein
MLKKLTYAAAVSVLFPSMGLAATSAQDFVGKAAVSNMFEIESSQLALKNASSADVKAFAQQMIDDHTKAGNELKSTLANVGTIQAPGALDAAHKTSLDALAGKTGAAFDDAYIVDQMKAHDEAVTLFTDYSTSGDNPALKDFAGKTLPVLKSHQQHVQMLSATVGKSPSSGNSTSADAALLEGANSFTEGQTRDRLTAAGYTSVQALAKDDKGIWRGTATKDGKSVSVGLDYKGNIATQ